MTKRIPLPRPELSPEIRAREAELLAVMLRTSRLTLLLAEPGADKTALLKSGLMPLLQRRRSDRLDQGATVAAPAKERRSSRFGQAGLPRIEAAVYFDAWQGSAYADLLSRVADLTPPPPRRLMKPDAPLAHTLAFLQDRFGFHCVFLLDRFEELLALPAHDPALTRFIDELAAALQHPSLQASFLIAVDEAALPRMALLRQRVPGFDHNVLRIAPIAGIQVAAGPAPKASTRPAQADTATPPPPKPKPVRRTPPPRVPIKVDEVYAFIEATLSRTSAQAGRPEPPPAHENPT